MDNTKVGEIIEAGSAAFTAQCYELYQSPPFGSLVKTGGETELFGVVYDAVTGSLEPGRRPIARGRDEASEEGIFRASPQLARLLRSDFSALVIGHRHDGKLHHYLPPQPARIHGFVYTCTEPEVRELSQPFDFLGILLNAGVPGGAEELTAAALRNMSRAQADPRAFLVAAGKELAVLLSGQFNRLRDILGRVRP